MDFSEEKLLDLNSRGLVPGPKETSYEFKQRIDNIAGFDKLKVCVEKDLLKWHDFDWARSSVNQLFDISPDWVSAYYSNKGLRFWQGAVTYVFQEKNPQLVLQIRKQLKNKKYLFLYERDEILSHELVHAARSGFNEPKTEELLAYWTSTSHLRKLFGPIFRNSVESTIFMSFVGVEFLLQLLIPFSCSLFFVFILQFFYLASLTMLSLLTFRLFRVRSKVNLALKKLTTILSSKRAARAVLFRLTDKEIYFFAKTAIDGILEYINKEKLSELRWKVIYLAYFKNF